MVILEISCFRRSRSGNQSFRISVISGDQDLGNQRFRKSIVSADQDLGNQSFRKSVDSGDQELLGNQSFVFFEDQSELLLSFIFLFCYNFTAHSACLLKK